MLRINSQKTFKKLAFTRKYHNMIIDQKIIWYDKCLDHKKCAMDFVLERAWKRGNGDYIKLLGTQVFICCPETDLVRGLWAWKALHLPTTQHESIQLNKKNLKFHWTKFILVIDQMKIALQALGCMSFKKKLALRHTQNWLWRGGAWEGHPQEAGSNIKKDEPKLPQRCLWLLVSETFIKMLWAKKIIKRK